MKHGWHSSHTGSKTENIFERQLKDDGYRFIREKVAHSRRTAATSKGKFDFRINLSNYDHCIEVKSNAGNITIPTRTSNNPNIKTHQLEALRQEQAKGNKAGLLLHFRSVSKWFYFDLRAFDKMVVTHYPLKAITPKLAEIYGTCVGHGDELDIKFVEAAE